VMVVVKLMTVFGGHGVQWRYRDNMYGVIPSVSIVIRLHYPFPIPKGI
jgi:hypothetical protein